MDVNQVVNGRVSTILYEISLHYIVTHKSLVDWTIVFLYRSYYCLTRMVLIGTAPEEYVPGWRETCLQQSGSKDLAFPLLFSTYFSCSIMLMIVSCYFRMCCKYEINILKFFEKYYIVPKLLFKIWENIHSLHDRAGTLYVRIDLTTSIQPPWQLTICIDLHRTRHPFLAIKLLFVTGYEKIEQRNAVLMEKE